MAIQLRNPCPIFATASYLPFWYFDSSDSRRSSYLYTLVARVCVLRWLSFRMLWFVWFTAENFAAGHYFLSAIVPYIPLHFNSSLISCLADACFALLPLLLHLADESPLPSLHAIESGLLRVCFSRDQLRIPACRIISAIAAGRVPLIDFWHTIWDDIKFAPLSRFLCAGCPIFTGRRGQAKGWWFQAYITQYFDRRAYSWWICVSLAGRPPHWQFIGATTSKRTTCRTYTCHAKAYFLHAACFCWQLGHLMRW